MKTIFPLLLIALLAACRPAASPEATQAVPELTAPSAVSAAAPTAAEILPGRPAGLELSSKIEGPPMDGCTLQRDLGLSDSEEESLFPPVTGEDWRSGPDEAATTIIEYGDFQ